MNDGASIPILILTIYAGLLEALVIYFFFQVPDFNDCIDVGDFIADDTFAGVEQIFWGLCFLLLLKYALILILL